MGKFVWKETKSGFSFNLKAGNGEPIASSTQSYSSKSACMKGIESVRRNCVAPIEDQTTDGFKALKNPKFEIFTDAAGEFRFRLKAKNGQNIAKSEDYKTKASCLNGIESIRKNAPEAEIVKE